MGAFFEKISVNKHYRNVQTNCITSFFGKLIKKEKETDSFSKSSKF